MASTSFASVFLMFPVSTHRITTIGWHCSSTVLRRLFLNEEHSAVINALYDTTKRGKRAAVREALYDQVSAVVWPSLLLNAARAWQENDGDIYTWQVNVLRLWAKRLWPDEYDLDAGVEKIAQRAQNCPADLVLEINAFLQREDQVRHIERLLAEVAQ